MEKIRWVLFRCVRGLALAAALLGVGLPALLGIYVLPNADRWRDDIATVISDATGTPVAIGRVQADWHEGRPRLQLDNVRVYDRSGGLALTLGKVDATVGWRSLAVGEPRLRHLVVHAPSLLIQRDRNGVIYIAGFAVNRDATRSPFPDWLLRQRHFRIFGATVTWRDDLRGAPPLVLTDVLVDLDNHGTRHALRLRAKPPVDLSAPIEATASLEGKTVHVLEGWNGSAQVEFSRADFTRLPFWFPLPQEILSAGVGQVKAKAEVTGGRIAAVDADLSLTGVSARLAPDLPSLDFKSLVGKVIWKPIPTGADFSVKGMTFQTAAGEVVPPADFSWRQTPASGYATAETRMTAHGVQLEALSVLSAAIPMPAELRTRLRALAPRGRLDDFSLSLKGEPAAPSDYQANGSFSDLSWLPHEGHPGAAHLTGRVDAGGGGGTLLLDSRGAEFTAPEQMRFPMAFDTLAGAVTWQRRDRTFDIRLSRLAFANPDAAGEVSARYQLGGDHDGEIELDAKASRLQVAATWRYLPLSVNEHTLEWLQRALAAGTARDVTLKLRGPLKHFPFRRGGGEFRAAGHIDQAVLVYGPEWPEIQDLSADIAFNGPTMEIKSRAGRILNVALRKVTARIPDLWADEETLTVDGEAAGPTSGFLQFIRESPIDGRTDRITHVMRAHGDGELSLRLIMPLRHTDDARVEGRFAVVRNKLLPGEGFPVLENLAGALTFTKSSVTGHGLSTRVFGGSAGIEVVTLPAGAIRVTARGRMSADELLGRYDNLLTRSLSGAADWQAELFARSGRAEFTLSSDLRGIAINLPPPLAKAADEPAPLRVFVQPAEEDRHSVNIRYANLLNGILIRRAEIDEAKVERGVFRFGAGELVLPASGVWVSGTIRDLNFDAWRRYLAGGGEKEGGPVEGFNLTFNRLRAFGRPYTDTNVQLGKVDGQWRAVVAGKDIAGDLRFVPPGPAGRERIIGRFTRLALPMPGPEAEAGPPMSGSDVPALDIQAEEFAMHGRPLGKLALLAQPAGRGLVVEKLRLTSADAAINVHGDWNRRAAGTTTANVRLDVHDIGKFLDRLGYGGLVRRGKATIDGDISWTGSPTEIHYASLGGRLSLAASKGQFLKASPGVGKLLGVLSLQSLPRRISLDFRDVFSQGFAFDEISGNILIYRGIMYSNDFSMAGPAATVNLSGEAAIQTETQQLRVRITPRLDESLAIAGAIAGGPVVGFGALIAQKLLKDPLGKATTYEYLVTGPWDEPLVTKLARAPDRAQDTAE